MDVWCVWCVLLGRGLCDELFTRPEESCVIKKPRERGGHSSLWAAEPARDREKIIVTEINFATPCNVHLLKTKLYEVT
jgi:hypothetical protein